MLRLTAAGTVSWAWHQGRGDDCVDQYPLGVAAHWTGSAWEALPYDDFAFETTGKGYSRLTTATTILLLDVNYLVWSHLGEFYGPDLTQDPSVLATRVNQWILLFGMSDGVGYMMVPFLFESISAGRMFVWGWKVSLA